MPPKIHLECLETDGLAHAVIRMHTSSLLYIWIFTFNSMIELKTDNNGNGKGKLVVENLRLRIVMAIEAI